MNLTIFNTLLRVGLILGKIFAIKCPFFNINAIFVYQIPKDSANDSNVENKSKSQ